MFGNASSQQQCEVSPSFLTIALLGAVFGGVVLLFLMALRDHWEWMKFTRDLDKLFGGRRRYVDDAYDLGILV
jgi:hypothetical protein